MTTIQLLIIIVSALTIGMLMIKYLEGDLSYEDKIIHRGNLVDSRDRIIGTFYTIQRTYESGRIKIITQKL